MIGWKASIWRCSSIDSLGCRTCVHSRRGLLGGTLGPLGIRLGHGLAGGVIPVVAIPAFAANLAQIVFEHTVPVAEERTVRFNFVEPRPDRRSGSVRDQLAFHIAKPRYFGRCEPRHAGLDRALEDVLEPGEKRLLIAGGARRLEGVRQNAQFGGGGTIVEAALDFCAATRVFLTGGVFVLRPVAVLGLPREEAVPGIRPFGATKPVVRFSGQVRGARRRVGRWGNRVRPRQISRIMRGCRSRCDWASTSVGICSVNAVTVIRSTFGSQICHEE